MKNRLINGLLCMFLVPLLLFSLNLTANASDGMDVVRKNVSNQAPSDVIAAAKAGLSKLPSIVSSTPEGELSLGEIFLVNTMHPDAVMKATEGIGSLIESTGMWQAMVLLNGKPHLMMTIDQMNGEWKAVAYGADSFAKELSQVRQAWPAEKGYQLRNIRLYQARADLIQVVDRKGQEVGFVPLTSAKVAFGLEKTDFDPAMVLSSAKVLTSSKQALTEAQSQ